MAKGDDDAIELVVRDMRSGDAHHQSFVSEDEACAWLRERPRFVTVLGVTHELPEGTTERLEAAIRPLDAEEREEASALEERDASMAEATGQIERAVARGFMLENRWGDGWPRKR